MPTVESVDAWIQANVLDADAWIKNVPKQTVAVTQAIRNLSRWYPDTALTDEIVSYQAIWELEGINPALKLQRHGVKSVSDNGESISYNTRDKVAPEVRQLLGLTADEKPKGNDVQYGGVLL
jgi:hypothetical protein